MPMVNIPEAKADLSRWVQALESGEADEVIISREGRPAARLVPVRPVSGRVIIGLASGVTDTPAPETDDDAEMSVLFGVANERQDM